MALVAKAVYLEVRDARQLAPDQTIDQAALVAFGCDVSFVSDHSTPAEQLVARAVEQASSQDVKQVLRETFDRLRADYEVANAIAHPAAVATRVRQAASTLGIQLPPEQRDALLSFFDDVNKTLFQHQTLSWLAGDANLKLHVYGSGWERHPALARHARGPISDKRT